MMLISSGWLTSPTSVCWQSSCIWPWCWMPSHGVRWVGRWGATCKLLCHWPLWKAQFQNRQPSLGLIHHSDRGTHYASNDYVKRLEGIGAVLSMSRPARPWENGQCESFLKTLKREEINARPYRTMEELEQHLEEFIEQIYNRVRLHSALGYRSPAEFEQQQALRKTEATWLPAALSFRRHQEIYPDDHLLH